MSVLKIKDPTTGNWLEIQTIKGDTGPQGPKGDKGDKGDPGQNGTATDAQVAAWLDNHPEATTTVQDGSISIQKLVSELQPNFYISYYDKINWPSSVPTITDGVYNYNIRRSGPTPTTYGRTVHLPCSMGDQFYVYGQGFDANAPLWAFIDSEYNVLANQEYKAEADGYTIIAPEGAMTLVVAVKTAPSPVVWRLADSMFEDIEHEKKPKAIYGLSGVNDESTITHIDISGNNTGGTLLNPLLTFISGKVYSVIDGELIDSSSGAYTDAFRVVPNSKAYIGNYVGYIAYDINKRFLYGVGASDGTDLKLIITIPDNVYYIAIFGGSSVTSSSTHGYYTVRVEDYVSDVKYSISNLSIPYSSITGTDRLDEAVDNVDILLEESSNNVEAIDFSKKLQRAFTAEEIIFQNKKIPYSDAIGVLSPYPFAPWDTTQLSFIAYDSENHILQARDDNTGDINGRSDLGMSTQRRTILTFTQTGFRIDTYTNIDEYRYKMPHAYQSYTWIGTPVSIYFSSFSKNKVFFSDDMPSSNKLLRASINESSSVGLLEQTTSKAMSSVYGALESVDNVDSDDAFRRVKSGIIRMVNGMRKTMRIATFNVRGSGGFGQNNWPVLKQCLENFGIDICGMQEVSFPLENRTGRGNLVEFFTGWLFPYVSDNGDAYRKGDGEGNEGKNERNLLSRYPIDSTEEFSLTMGTDYRLVAKSIISLPKYMDKRGSENLKMSVYNFQLEVSGSNAQINAREVVDIVRNDPNPFIILMGDCNDFTLTKEVYRIFEAAGFTTVVSTNTATVSQAVDLNTIDNFFLSKRISAIDYDVISAMRFPWVGPSGYTSMLSDHDLVISDVVLDYSDIRCVNYNLTNCTATADKTWLSDDESLVITITPNDGYTLGQITAKDCDRPNTNGIVPTNSNGIVTSGNTITLHGEYLIGDVLITANATANS